MIFGVGWVMRNIKFKEEDMIKNYVYNASVLNKFNN